jgi:pyruvate-ferredoxin/flavodoxin oxidoreductase
MGANDAQTLKAFLEAEAYNGPSLIIAYSHCPVNHGIHMTKGMEQQKLATQAGYWPLFRFNPELARAGQIPLQLDSKPPSLPLEKYVYNETRYKMLELSDPDTARQLLAEAQADVYRRWNRLVQLSKLTYSAEQ